MKGGGTLKDLGKRFADAGLAVPDAIGFAEWLVNDDDRRKKGLENAKRDMDKVLAVGGKCIAAPPVASIAMRSAPVVSSVRPSVNGSPSNTGRIARKLNAVTGKIRIGREEGVESQAGLGRPGRPGRGWSPRA